MKDTSTHARLQQIYPRRGKAPPTSAPLRKKERLPIGFGNSEVGPLSFHLNANEDYDAGFLKLFLCTSPVKMESISQAEFGRGSARYSKEWQPPRLDTWDAKIITVRVVKTADGRK